ncbi:hypothetical protein BKI52_37605 [marine bacterium AO1-C]|nr:hypothetical protein BKI52_37605 [marine bacterium AO1-C]
MMNRLARAILRNRQNLAAILVFFTIVQVGFGQTDTIIAAKTNPLLDDAYLHPVDGMSPYTLKKGEWIYAQSIQTLPFPSWAFVGITDKLTAQIDLLPWVFGAFSELRRPIPSFNLRYRFNKQKGLIPTIAVESMFVHFWDTLQRFDTQNLTMWENGSYFHFKPVIGYKIRKKWFLNLSAGVDYIGELIMQNKDSLNFQTKTFKNSWNPNFSFSLSYRSSKWISYHFAYTYGATLTYLENIPRKHQLNYGFRIAPFYKNKWAFLRNLRIELVAINAFFSDINAQEVFPLPVFPYFYWQWQAKKRRKRPKKG